MALIVNDKQSQTIVIDREQFGRLLAGMAGGYLILRGLSQFTIGGMLSALGGGALINYAATGSWPRLPEGVKQAPEKARRILDRASEQGKSAVLDEVEEASEESFPASDAPSWAGTSAGPPGHEVP